MPEVATTTDDGGFDAAALDWGKGDGLLPAIVQDARTLRVLMLGYMDRAALAASVFHSGAIAIPELKQTLRGQGIKVRL